MKKTDLKQFVLSCKNEVVDSNVNLDRITNECWGIYRNEQDYSSKENWQAKVCIPEGQSAVRRAQGVIRSSLTRPRDFFDIKHGTNAEDMKLRMMNQFRDQDVGFIQKFVEGIGSGLVQTGD